MNIHRYIFGGDGRAGIAGITNEMDTFSNLSEPLDESEIKSIVTSYITGAVGAEQSDIDEDEAKEMLSDLDNEIDDIVKEHAERFADYEKNLPKEEEEEDES